jgi:hypothetical protein
MWLMRTKTPKGPTERALVYDALAAFNQGFAQILQNLSSLETLGLLEREVFTGLQVTLEETRAWANFEVIDMLHGLEESDWSRFGRLRRHWEKKFEDPRDVLLEAARLKKPRRKSVGTKRALKRST